jgi:hypothetical protein
MKTLILFGLCIAVTWSLCPTAGASGRGLGEWTLNPGSMPYEYQRGFATCTYQNWVYILGGDSTGASTSAMDYAGFARIQADRTLGPWTETTPLPRRLWIPQAIQYGGWVYLIGGYQISGSSREVYRAQIQPNGTLGAWQPQNPLPAAMYGHTSVLYGSRIYVLGNWYEHQVFFVEIQPDGTLGTWHTTTSLPEFLYASDAAIVGDRLFVFGGKEIIDGVQTIVPHVRYADIQPSGHLTVWTSTDPMPQARWFHQVEFLCGRVFVVGGAGAGGLVPEVTEGEIFPDGSVAWTNIGTIPNPTSGNGLAQMDAYLYYLPGAWDNRIYYAEMQTPSPVFLSECLLEACGSSVLLSWRVSDADREFRVVATRGPEEWEVACRETGAGAYAAEDDAPQLADGGTIEYALYIREPGDQWQKLRVESIILEARGTTKRPVEAWPSPFREDLTCAFQLPRSGPARLGVWDLSGRQVAVLADGIQTSGGHRVEWNGLDRQGDPVPCGSYLLRLEAGGRIETCRIIRLR